MTLNQLKQEVKEFEQKAGFSSTNAGKLMEMLRKKAFTLSSNLDKEVAAYQLIDLLVLTLQLANRFNTDLDEEWIKHFKKAEKYL